MTGFPARAGGLSFVTPVAYDYRYAWAAIRSYYAIADEIILGLDKGRVAWSGRPFSFDERDFRRGLEAVDPLRKITLVEGDFHSQHSAFVNDTFERNALSLRCRQGNWIVSIDSDELVRNPGEFRDWLLKRRWSWKVLARGTTVFKRCGDDYLVVDRKDDWIRVGTRRPARYASRDVPGFKRRSPLRILHFAWGRSEEELRQKLESWGHVHEFDAAKYLDFWESVDRDNYGRFSDIHPVHGPEWPALRLIRKGDPDWVAAP